MLAHIAGCLFGSTEQGSDSHCNPVCQCCVEHSKDSFTGVWNVFIADAAFEECSQDLILQFQSYLFT